MPARSTSFIILLCSLGLAACGGGSSGGGGQSDVVSFEVDPVAGPQCFGATETSSYEGTFTTFVDCTWFCADYKNRTDAYVDISFAREQEPGATWSKDSEFISDGIC